VRTVGWILLVTCALAVVCAAALLDRRGGRLALRRRFGPEYDRAVAEHGGRRAAERRLAHIVDQRDALAITPLSEADRAAFTTRWRTLQGRFVDDPAGATTEADALVADVMRSRGYPAVGFAERAELLSADHPGLVAGYREAHEWSGADPDHDGAGARPDTERLRSAFVRYRDLFDELVGTDDAPVRTPTGTRRAG
jgi:hypothetical protein